MKKVLLMMLAFATISAGLISCGDEDPVEPMGCEACGTYEGNFNTNGQTATILIDTAGTGLNDEVLEDTPFNAVVTEGSSSDKLNMLVTLQVTVAGTAIPVPVPVDVVVNYDASTNTFAANENEDYSISVLSGALIIEAKLVSMTGSFATANDVSGTIVLDDATGATDDLIDATFYFSATK